MADTENSNSSALPVASAAEEASFAAVSPVSAEPAKPASVAAEGAAPVDSTDSASAVEGRRAPAPVAKPLKPSRVKVSAPAATSSAVTAQAAGAKPRSVAKAGQAVRAAKPVKIKPTVSAAGTAKAPLAPKPAKPAPVFAASAPAAKKVSASPILPQRKSGPGVATRPAAFSASPVSRFPELTALPIFKDNTMDMSANFSGFQDAMSEAQAKAKAAFDKSASVLGEAGEFTKGNLEAFVESGKILAEGAQEIGSTMATEGRVAFETLTGDIKELAAAKSPTDFLKVQSEILRRNFDTAVAYSSKNSETMLKLFSDAFAPISGRVSLAVEKARQTPTF